MDDKIRMQIIADNITYYRKLKGITQKELSKEVGITASTMTDYMKLRSAPSFGVIQKIADYFGVKKSDIDSTFKDEESTPQEIPSSVSKLNSELNTENHGKWVSYGNELLEEQNTVQEEPAEYSSDKVVSIKKKLFKYHVYEKLSAGTGESYFNDWNYDEVYYDEEIDHDFASWIFGDSMEPRFLNGEVALIKDTGFDYDGAIYAVEWDGQTYIKKVKREKDGLRLISLNSKYKDKFAPYDEDPRIIGKIVGSFQPISI